MKALKAKIEDLRKREAKDTSGDDWVKKVYNQMNSDGNRHFREGSDYKVEKNDRAQFLQSSFQK